MIYYKRQYLFTQIYFIYKKINYNERIDDKLYFFIRTEYSADFISNGPNRIAEYIRIQYSYFSHRSQPI